jgi:hypothetical protein
MLQLLLGFFAAYILYNFIFRFVIPLVRVTRQVKKQVRSFREQSNAGGAGYQQGGFQQRGYQGGFQQESFGSGSYQNTSSTYGDNSGHASVHTNTSTAGDKPRPKSDDYIDFEEVK